MAQHLGRLAVLPVAAAFLLAGSSIAFAEDRPEPSRSPSARASASAQPTPRQSSSEKEDKENHPAPTARPSAKPEDGDSDHHQEIQDKYGNDIDKVFLPPLVVTPSTPVDITGPSGTLGSAGKPGVKPGIKPPLGITQPLPAGSRPISSNLKKAGLINPAANLPINPDVSQVSSKSPADRFFEAATFGLGVMGIGSVVLGGAAVVQRRRHRTENH